MKTELEQNDRTNLSPAEKKKALFDQQKELLDIFLGNHAISRQQYEKSLGDLKKKILNAP